MVDIFRKRIRTSLANENLQFALDANAERRISARKKALNSLPEDWHVLRKRARDVRLETINNLDAYLEQFINQVKANGIQVHRAEDANQAVSIVSAIARDKGAGLIVKSKTMVSEEIELNQTLEGEGIEVVETDLGEFIIQLRGEPPAHIITPAVHLRKEEVGETFQDKLGIPFTTDITVMTAAARKRLRRYFLEADIGISGINFGVVESGTLCIVTNEGNGRMVTTLPPVHIALMGIERLVPSMDDLGLMLNLLPRSATGQLITVYTNLINAPRQPEDPDGPQERHLILVDNGRHAVRNSPLTEALLCIRCGACLNACPVFAEIGGHAYVSIHGESSTYPGPIGSVISPGLFGQAEFGHLARASSLCGACREACPVDIDLPKLLLRVRAGGTEKETQNAEKTIPIHIKWALQFYTWIASNPRRFSSALKLAGVFSRIAAPRSSWLRLPAFTGWGYSKDLPRPARKPFRERWSRVSIANQEKVQKTDQFEQSDSENYDKPLASDTALLVDRLAAELSALDASFTYCTLEELPDLVGESLKELGISSILSWDEKLLPDGLIQSLLTNGIEVSQDFDPQVQAGLSGALAAIAETGTLVLPSGAGRGQFVSLTPEIHIAVLDSRSIYQDLSQVLNLPELREASAISLISGPSRTADIEMTLTIGVHGPSQVRVFCFKGE
jgi:L-lactate dehydrogenase complex protein LldF